MAAVSYICIPVTPNTRDCPPAADKNRDRLLEVYG
jgi:hypothetical protein